MAVGASEAVAEAPHLRRLVASSEAPGAGQWSRELRRDMRTLGWLLHHAGQPSRPKVLRSLRLVF